MALSQNLMTLAKTAGIAAGALAAFPKLAQAAGSATIESARENAEFSSQTAAAMLSLDAARFQIHQERAQATQESTAALVASQIQLERAMAPLANELKNLQNVVLADIATHLAQVVKELNKFFGVGDNAFTQTAVIKDILQRGARGEFVQTLPPMA